MVCPNCQEHFEANDLFCGNCGLSLQGRFVQPMAAMSPAPLSLPSSTPPGWYQDPSVPHGGQLRYWDGGTWTQYTHPQATSWH